MADYSPMMKQYFALKESMPGAILFFRLGDFYEMFYEDAKLVSEELSLTLTGRDCGQEERAPMCGVPYHSAESYLAKLVKRGHKVAICEQTEDPKQVKGLVKRKIVRVVTPGTVIESSMLEETSNNYIGALYYDGTENRAGLCMADVSTGDLQICSRRGKDPGELQYRISNDLARFAPKELLIHEEVLDLTGLRDFIKDRLQPNLELLSSEAFGEERARELVCRQFQVSALSELPAVTDSESLRTLGALLGYLKETQGEEGSRRLQSLRPMDQGAMNLDANTRRNLELTQTMRSKERKGSLLWVLDRTKTAMGKRLLKAWVEQPLCHPAQIIQRQNAVEALTVSPSLLEEVQDRLSGIFDLERIMTRVVCGSANAREFCSLSDGFAPLPALKETLLKTESSLLNRLGKEMDGLADVRQWISRAIAEDPPFSIREGGMFRRGYNEELDRLLEDMQGGQGRLASVEFQEKEKTGIPKLKIGFNRVFGYFIEVSNSYKSKVPEHYIRKQTLSGGERYITEELKEIETRVLGAKEKSIALESVLFEELRKKLAAQLDRVQKTAECIAQVDVLTSFAQVSVQYDYTRPVINTGERLYLKESRHPVVERLLEDQIFVPNDVDMDRKSNRLAIITGPNMAGKSTYMRQVALIVIMAQMGCFVPVKAAEIGLVDGVFTRVGASDDLASGQSTFMVEMTEVADILKNATKNSLLIFDEIGRGTATFDGMSIAKGVLEYVQDPKILGALTFFATHYHELTVLEQRLPGVKNYSVAVKKKGDEISFLRRIIPAPADESYGIQVAKLAGVPERVIKGAKAALKELENGTMTIRGYKPSPQEPAQLTLESGEMRVLTRLKALKMDQISPGQGAEILTEICCLLQDPK